MSANGKMKRIHNIQDRNRKIGVPILLLIVFVALAFNVSAFTALSISPTDFQSNDPNLNGRAFLLSVVEDGSSQYAVGTIKAADISAKGFSAQNDLKIETKVNEQSCNYGLVQSNDFEILRFSNTKTNAWDWDVTNTMNQCKNNPNYYYTFATGGVLTKDVYCITYQHMGVPGIIQTPSTIFNADIIVTAKGETKKGTIGSETDRSVNIGNVAFAKWTGNLVSGEQCPILASEGFRVIHDITGNWRLINSASYENYRTRTIAFDSAINEVIYNKVSDASINNMLSALALNNGAADDAAKAVAYAKPVSFTSNDLNNGQMKLTLNKLIQFPLITMHVNADWLGVVIPVGEPKIVDISSSIFQEGTEGKIDMTIKNNGNVQASFSVSASCDAPFQMIRASTTLSGMNPGEIRATSLPITVTTNDNIERTCTVTVQDLEDGSKRDSKTVTVKATPLAVCSPGQTLCDGQTAKICNSQGSAYQQDTTDPTRCASDDGAKKIECEKQGGHIVVTTTNPPWYEFWASSTSKTECRIPRTPIIAVIFIIAGIALLIFMAYTGMFGNIPVWVLFLLLEAVGWIWFGLGRAGV